MERNKLGFNRQILLFFKYFGIFLVVPIVGTLLHELGHYLVAVSNGYEARIAYAYTISSIERLNEPEMYFYYILAGPLATWIESAIPFLILVIYYNKERRSRISEKGDLPPLYILLLGFIAFCGRFIFNAGGYMLSHSTSLDESRMADYLNNLIPTINIYPDIFVYPFSFIAWTMLIIVIYMLPRNIRFSVFLGAMIGAAVGYSLWYYFLGPILLPY